MPVIALPAVLLGLLLCLPSVWAAEEEPLPPAEHARADNPSGPAPVAKPTMGIQEAIDGIADEDEPTRRNAVARLTAATAADLPTLEKYADSADPEIRRQVRVVLKKLKRGEFAFVASFPNRQPAAQIKFSVKIYTGDAAPANDGNQIILANRGPMGAAKELAAFDCVADQTGRVSVGRFNDGDYLYTVEPQDPLPAQPITGKLVLRNDTKPLEIEVRRGVTVTVTVTDAEGHPVPDVTVYNSEDGNFLQQTRQMNPAQTRMMLGRASSATTDDKGVAVLEKVGLKEINIVAAKDTFDCAYQEHVAADDGGAARVSLTMVKTVPYKCQINSRMTQGKFPEGVRVLAIRQNALQKVLGQQWNLNLDIKNVDEFVKKGAIDLGESNKDAEFKTELLPDYYFLVGMTKDGKHNYFANINVVVKDGTMQALFRELPRPQH